MAVLPLIGLAVNRSMLVENGDFNRGRDRIQTPAFSTRTEHYAMAGFSLVTLPRLQKMATSIEAVKVFK